MTDFGKMLRDFRLRAEFSQRALALAADIDTSYISRLESGEREVSSRSLALRLSEILKLSPEEIDFWLISAGYISPRIQEVANSDTGKLRLMELLDLRVNEIVENQINPFTEEEGQNEK